MRSIYIAACALAFVACGEDDSADVVVTDEYGQVQGYYEDVGYDGAAADTYYYDGGGYSYLVVPRQANEVPLPLNALLRSWGALFGPDCIATEGNEDYDGDGVPATWNATFDCNGQLENRTASITGKAKVSDDDDSVPGGGRSLTFESFNVNVTDSGGVTRARTLNGTISIKAGDTLEINRRLTQQLRVTRPNMPEASATTAYDTRATYTPADDVKASAPLTRGTLAAAGTLQVTTASGTRTLTRRTDPDLSWNVACREGAVVTGAGFDAGRVIYSSPGARDVAISFSGCAASQPQSL